jgi:hypothetical protein
MSNTTRIRLLKPPNHLFKIKPCLEVVTNAMSTCATLSSAARICTTILRARPIRKRIFTHLGAFDVAKLIYASKIHCLLDANEIQQFLNPLRDIFTDAELKNIREMVRNGDILTIWGYDLRRLFDRVKRVASYTTKEDSSTRIHLWVGGGSLIPVTIPGNWVTPRVQNNVRYPLQIKTYTPDPTLSISQLDWEFVSCDIEGNVEMGVKVDLADLLGETMTGITRPRRNKPMIMPYINLSRGEMQLKSCEFGERKSVRFDTGVNLRLSLYDSAIDNGKEEVFGSYKLRLGSRG